MKNNNKIVNFDNYSNKTERNISDLRLYSPKKKRKYKLVRKALPYVGLASITLGILHFLGGYSIDDGKIMKESSYTYGSDEFFDSNGDKMIVYYGSWDKDSNGYSRTVDYYDAQYFSDDHVVDILKRKEDSILEDYKISSKIENRKYIPFNEFLFNDSSMHYYSYNNKGYDEVSNVGMSGIFFPIVLGAIFDVGAVLIGKNLVDSFETIYEDDENMIDFSDAKRRILKK